MRHIFSHEHNIEHDRLNIRAQLYYSIVKLTNEIIKNIFYMNVNCGIIAVVMSITMNIMGYFLSTAHEP